MCSKNQLRNFAKCALRKRPGYSRLFRFLCVDRHKMRGVTGPIRPFSNFRDKQELKTRTWLLVVDQGKKVTRLSTNTSPSLANLFQLSFPIWGSLLSLWTSTFVTLLRGSGVHLWNCRFSFLAVKLIHPRITWLALFDLKSLTQTEMIYARSKTLFSKGSSPTNLRESLPICSFFTRRQQHPSSTGSKNYNFSHSCTFVDKVTHKEHVYTHLTCSFISWPCLFGTSDTRYSLTFTQVTMWWSTCRKSRNSSYLVSGTSSFRILIEVVFIHENLETVFDTNNLSSREQWKEDSLRSLKITATKEKR